MEESLNPEIHKHKIRKQEKANTNQPRQLIQKIQLKTGLIFNRSSERAVSIGVWNLMDIFGHNFFWPIFSGV
jgi:hypothetical protein